MSNTVNNSLWCLFWVLVKGRLDPKQNGKLKEKMEWKHWQRSWGYTDSFLRGTFLEVHTTFFEMHWQYWTLEFDLEIHRRDDIWFQNESWCWTLFLNVKEDFYSNLVVYFQLGVLSFNSNWVMRNTHTMRLCSMWDCQCLQLIINLLNIYH